MKTTVTLLLFTLLITMGLSAQIIHVPADQPTIQQGITTAQDGDTVLVAEDIYFENINFKGKAIIVASQFLMDGDTSHISRTVINGSQATDPDSAAVVMFVQGEDTTSIIYGFTVTGGTGMYWDYWGIYGGGGIACSRAGAKILHNRIISNSVNTPDYVFGGGIACDTDNGEHWVVIEDNLVSNNQLYADSYVASSGGIYIGYNARIRNNIIEGNTVTCPNGQASGGGIRWDSEPSVLKTVHFDHNIVRNNSAEGDVVIGAGVMAYKSVTEIINNIIDGNIAQAASYGRGSGLFCMETQGDVLIHNNLIKNNLMESGYRAWGSGISTLLSKGKVIISENLIMNNFLTAADSSMGAGIMLGPQGAAHSMMILNNRVIGNVGTETSHGGGVACYLDEEAEVVFDGNVITGNKALNGGGICLENLIRVDLINNIFALDTALSNGGAVCLGNPSGPLSSSIGSHFSHHSGIRKDQPHPFFCNNTFVTNQASAGGAVYSDYSDSYPIFLNSIFWDNDAFVGKDLYQAVSFDLPVYYCEIDTSGIMGEWSGERNIYQDPSLCDENCHISWWDSPCWNAGINQVEINGIVYYAPDHDFEGTLRPGDSITDIGADEDLMGVGREELQVTGSKLQVIPNPTCGRSEIKYQISRSKNVLIEIHDIHGVRIVTLINKVQDAGEHSVSFDASGLPAGIYFVRFQSSGTTAVQKLVVMH